MQLRLAPSVTRCYHVNQLFTIFCWQLVHKEAMSGESIASVIAGNSLDDHYDHITRLLIIIGICFCYELTLWEVRQ